MNYSANQGKCRLHRPSKCIYKNNKYTVHYNITRYNLIQIGPFFCHSILSYLKFSNGNFIKMHTEYTFGLYLNIYRFPFPVHVTSWNVKEYTENDTSCDSTPY